MKKKNLFRRMCWIYRDNNLYLTRPLHRRLDVWTWPCLLSKASRLEHGFSQHGPGAWGGPISEGRQRYVDYCIKISSIQRKKQKGKKLILTNWGLWELQVRLSSIYCMVRSRAPSVCTSVLNPKRPSDRNSGDPVKQSAMPLEELKGIVRMFASV